MEIRYELTPEEFARSAEACDHLDPIRPTAMAVRSAAAVAAGIAALLAVGCAVGGWWSAAGSAAAAALALAAFHWFTSDRARRARNTPDGPVAQGVRLTDAALVDLVRAGGGERAYPWARVERVVDLGWAWFVGLGHNEWLAVPKRAVPEQRQAWVAAELRQRTGRELEALP